MKKTHMQSIHFLRVLMPAAICFVYALAPHTAAGQTYYSTFPSPMGKFAVTAPTGCTAPAIQNPSFFADLDVNNYTSFSGTISSPLSCTNGNYTFKTLLRLPPDSSYVNGGLQAAFRIRIPSHISPTVLAQNVTLQTLLDNAPAESFSGSSMHLIDIATDSTRFFVYANTTMKFNQVQLTVNSNIIPLNTAFEFDVIYGLASNADLPVTISNYKATPAGNNVTVSWQSVNEANISSYRIERSSNNGVSYAPVATLPAKGGSGVINYSFTDKAVANGNYLYRIAVADKEGLFKTTNAVLVTIAGKAYLMLVPSVVKAGQPVVVNYAAGGAYHVAVYDVQGRMIKQQQVNNGDKATINTGSLSAGTYVVKIITASGNISQSKFIVN